MNVMEDNEFSRAWDAAGKALPKPKAVICISAHWVTRGTLVTAMDKPRTIYDFYGFPPQMYEIRYDAPGSPDLAEQVRRIIKNTEVQPDLDWGLDHGTWTVLKRMFPEADVPVIQMSLDANIEAQKHYDISRQLKELRDEDVLIIGVETLCTTCAWRASMIPPMAGRWTLIDASPIGSRKMIMIRSFIMKKATRPRRWRSTAPNIIYRCSTRWH